MSESVSVLCIHTHGEGVVGMDVCQGNDTVKKSPEGHSHRHEGERIQFGLEKTLFKQNQNELLHGCAHEDLKEMALV